MVCSGRPNNLIFQPVACPRATRQLGVAPGHKISKTFLKSDLKAKAIADLCPSYSNAKGGTRPRPLFELFCFSPHRPDDRPHPKVFRHAPLCLQPPAAPVCGWHPHSGVLAATPGREAPECPKKPRKPHGVSLPGSLHHSRNNEHNKNTFCQYRLAEHPVAGEGYDCKFYTFVSARNII